MAIGPLNPITRTTTAFLFLSLFFLMTGRAYAQTVRDSAANRQLAFLYFDKEKLTPKQQETVILAFIRIQQSNKTLRTITIKEADNLYKIIKNKFNYQDDAAHSITRLLKTEISRINNIKNFILKAGAVLKLPQIPIQTAKGRTDELTQYFDIYNQISQLYPSNTLATRDTNKTQSAKPFNQASLFAYQLTEKDINHFISLISDSLFRQLSDQRAVRVFDTIPRMVQINYLNKQTTPYLLKPKPESAESDKRVRDLLSNLKKGDFGNFYVLDDFTAICPHGDKVLDVIHNVLERFRVVPQLVHILPVSVNYFDKEKDNLQLIKDFYSQHADKIELDPLINLDKTASLNYLDDYKKSGKTLQTCKECVPEVFMSALFKKYYYDLPDLISTSFYVPTPDRIMPIMTDTTTYVVTAGLNDSGAIEAELQRGQSPGITPTTVEPLATYAKEYDSGGIIVGARLFDGVYDGMYAKGGKLMTTLGQGTNWGTIATCIQPDDCGTSYATPEVATKLYLAKAFWRSKQIRLKATEARRRLILATDIDQAFVGKFASGGTVNLEKLLQTGDGYAETNDGQILPIVIDEESRNNSIRHGQKAISLFARRHDPKSTDYFISGLISSGQLIYQYEDDNPLWRLTDITGLNIHLRFANGKTDDITDTKYFIKKYRQIVILR